MKNELLVLVPAHLRQPSPEPSLMDRPIPKFPEVFGLDGEDLCDDDRDTNRPTIRYLFNKSEFFYQITKKKLKNVFR